MSKLRKGAIFSTYEAVKEEVALENDRFGPPAYLRCLRTKRRKEGGKNVYFGCNDNDCPARMVVQQKAKIDEEGLMKEIFEITACNLTHHCERVRPASSDVKVKVSEDAIYKLAAKKLSNPTLNLKQVQLIIAETMAIGEKEISAKCAWEASKKADKLLNGTRECQFKHMEQRLLEISRCDKDNVACLVHSENTRPTHVESKRGKGDPPKKGRRFLGQALVLARGSEH